MLDWEAQLPGLADSDPREHRYSTRDVRAHYKLSLAEVPAGNMPPRFAEVVDVSAEASSTIAALLARGGGLVSELSFNVSDYLNSTTADALWDTLAAYNLTVDALPADLGAALRAAGINVTAPDEYVPEGRARSYMLTSLALLVSREIYVRWRVSRMLRGHGMHKH